MNYLLEILGWWGMSIIKFLITPTTMVVVGKGLLETILISTTGAWIGIFVFSFFGNKLFAYLSKRARRRGVKVFTSSRRRIVRVKQRYGIYGLVAVCALISVPISSLLAAKYFHHLKWRIPALMGGFAIWSVLLTLIGWLARGGF
jgi:hypothetical protein